MKVVRFLPLLFVLLGLGLLGVVFSDGNTKNARLNEECGRHEKCSDCIQTLGCFWCNDESLPFESKRCFSKIMPGIPCRNSENPVGKLTETTAEIKEKRNINPQVVQLSLRKGEKRNITIQYTDVKNRPLDLYIVMDLSCSMKQHKDTVASLAETLAENLKNLTSELRIGFGSFVDKPLAPFGFLDPKKELSKCDETDPRPQSLPYGFKNHLKLTDDVPLFINEVKTAGIGSNIDFPEATLDGLLQSIVCADEIGWRKGNRRLVVVSTDGGFHLAGDGKLVGVVLPHDGKCYMDSGKYTHDAILDYPSISVVQQKIRENNVFVIFAVTKDQEVTYKQLSQQLHPFAVTQGIDNDNNSITSVIENQYRELVNTVTMLNENKHKDYVDTKIYALCPGDQDYTDNNHCNGVGYGVNVSFKIEVELKGCPSNSDLWKSNITIYPQSSNDDISLINLRMLCGCNCEAKSLVQKDNSIKSKVCSGNGYLQCGKCECDLEFRGHYCNCSVEDTGLTGKNDECVDPNSGDVCNKRGSCDSCGRCECNSVNENLKAYGGKYCECNNMDCPQESTDKGLCNEKAEGAPQGHCECSVCKCNPRFNGSRCECPTSDKSCRDQDALSPDKPCNGFGKCQCGKCLCDAGYKGTYCESQHARLNGSCEAVRGETKKCVKCLVSENVDGMTDGRRTEYCEDDCKNIRVWFKHKLAPLQINEEENFCTSFEEDSKGCRVDYIIRDRHVLKNTITLEVEADADVLREKCPVPPPLLQIIIGIVGSMVLIGIMLLLLWKIVTHIQDRKEYERFEKAINEAAWNTHENALYEPATSHFKNPVFVDYQESKFD